MRICRVPYTILLLFTLLPKLLAVRGDKNSKEAITLRDKSPENQSLHTTSPIANYQPVIGLNQNVDKMFIWSEVRAEDQPLIDPRTSIGDITTHFALLLIPFLAFLMLALLISARLEDATSAVLNRSVMSTVCGVVAGLLMRHWIAPRNGLNLKAWQRRVLSDNSMDKYAHPFIFLLIFPYLFWPSGWFARVDYLCFHWYWIVLAFLGPIMSTLVTVQVAHLGHFWFRSLFYTAEELVAIQFRELYLMAACISIVDPTPLLFAMGDLRVPTIVSVTVLWESLFAPDTATLLVERASIPTMQLDGLDLSTIWELMGPSRTIVTQIIPSGVFGFFIGLVISSILRTRWLRVRPQWEAICIGWTPILAHAVATGCGFWAILADVPCGLAMNLYGRKQLSEEGLSLADKLVTQNTLFVCTSYYFVIGLYFTMATEARGVVLGLWIFFCGIIGRLATVMTCVPLAECIQRLCGTTRPAEQVDNQYRTSWRGLMSVLALGQTRGGVWFAMYFKYAICPNKALIVDAIVTVWLLSLLTFGTVPEILYKWFGMPSGVDFKQYHGDGVKYDDEWYTDVQIFKPFLMIHRCLVEHFFDAQPTGEVDVLGRATLEYQEAESDKTAGKGADWMGDASMPNTKQMMRRRVLQMLRSERTARAFSAATSTTSFENTTLSEASTRPY